jgi:hypothetical protein
VRAVFFLSKVVISITHVEREGGRERERERERDRERRKSCRGGREIEMQKEPSGRDANM